MKLGKMLDVSMRFTALAFVTSFNPKLIQY